MKRFLAVGVAALALALPGAVLGWGSSGHRLLGQAAMRALPAELPAFLRTPQAVVDVGEMSREPDRLKRAGRAFDTDRDQGHFLDLNDDGTVLGGPRVTALPPTRVDYEKALQAISQNSWAAGYLPYSILESYQVLTQDLAYWKVLSFAEANPAWAAHRTWFAEDRRRREAQILAAIGDLSHFVGDGSQPLHVTIHFNGWGDYPNPNGYTQAKIHAPFEGDLVRNSLKLADVEAKMSPLRPIDGPLEPHIGAYLAATGGQVGPLYELEKAGGLKAGDPRGKSFAAARLAVGASELRDLIVLAWRSADRQSVGWRPVQVADVLAGKVDPYVALAGVD
jgi:hypothetical protein